MKAAEFIKALQAMVAKYGDLPIVGGYLGDDTPPKKIIALNKNDGDVAYYTRTKAVAFFLEG